MPEKIGVIGSGQTYHGWILTSNGNTAGVLPALSAQGVRICANPFRFIRAFRGVNQLCRRVSWQKIEFLTVHFEGIYYPVPGALDMFAVISDEYVDIICFQSLQHFLMLLRAVDAGIDILAGPTNDDQLFIADTQRIYNEGIMGAYSNIAPMKIKRFNKGIGRPILFYKTIYL